MHVKPGLPPEHGTVRETSSDEENDCERYGVPLSRLAVWGSASCVFTDTTE